MTFAVAGQPSPLNSGRIVNQVLQSSDYYHGQVALGGAVKSKPGKLDADFVKVKNVSGGDLPRGSVVQLGDFLLTDKFQQFLHFEADAPTGNRRLVVLLEPIPNNASGPAVASGVCMALVNVSDISHEYAIPADSETVFDSAASGPLELLSDPDGTGEQEMIVRFQTYAPSFGMIEGYIKTAMTGADETHTIDNITVYHGTDPRDDPNSTSEEITVTNTFLWDADDDALAQAVWDESNSVWKLTQVQCPE